VSPDAAVNLHVGEEHPVRLTSLGTAGYRWLARVEGFEGVADATEAGLAELANERIGTRADELFTIAAVGPGATRVRVTQRRPFERVVEVRVT
jgi:predicted secreted protein